MKFIIWGVNYVFKHSQFDFKKGLSTIKNEIDNARNIEALCPPGNNRIQNRS